MSDNFNGLCILCLKPMTCFSRWVTKERPNQDREFQIQYKCDHCSTGFIRIFDVVRMDNGFLELCISPNNGQETWLISKCENNKDIWDEEKMS